MILEDYTDSPWAIMVCLDGKDDWIFVTEDTSNCDTWDLRPVLFEDIKDALEYATSFAVKGKEHNVKVISYNDKIKTLSGMVS